MSLKEPSDTAYFVFIKRELPIPKGILIVPVSNLRFLT